MPKDYKARPEQAILFTVAAWDANCPQHIPQRYEEADVEAALAEAGRRLAALEAEVKRLRELTGGRGVASGPLANRAIIRNFSLSLPRGRRADIAPLLPDRM